MKNVKLIIAVALFGFTSTFASVPETTSYTSLTTAQLQQKVEQLSLAGELPLDMALELIERWKN